MYIIYLTQVYKVDYGIHVLLDKDQDPTEFIQFVFLAKKHSPLELLGMKSALHIHNTV